MNYPQLAAQSVHEVAESSSLISVQTSDDCDLQGCTSKSKEKVECDRQYSSWKNPQLRYSHLKNLHTIIYVCELSLELLIKSIKVATIYRYLCISIYKISNYMLTDSISSFKNKNTCQYQVGTIQLRMIRCFFGIQLI